MIKIGIAEKDGIAMRLLRELLSNDGACVRSITHCPCDNRTMQTVCADYLLIPVDNVCDNARLDLILSVNSELCERGISTDVLLQNCDNAFQNSCRISFDKCVKFGMSNECDITASSIGCTDNGIFVSCCVQRRIEGILGNGADIGEYTFRIYGSNPPMACILGAASAYVMCKNTKKGETLLLY